MRLPKYSPLSLSLSIQSIRGYGRWGSERDFPKGWDQLHLKNILGLPFLDQVVVTPTPQGESKKEGEARHDGKKRTEEEEEEEKDDSDSRSAKEEGKEVGEEKGENRRG